MRSSEHGQIMIAGALLLMIVMLVAGGLVDVYRLQEVRAWAYRAAEAAALAGAAQGRGFSTVYTIGSPRLDPGVGYAGAEQALTTAIARRDLTGVTYRIEVSEWGGEEFAGFPPIARADLWSDGNWSVKAPAVGVYVEVAVPTFLLGLTQQGVVIVHAFAAAGIGGQ